MKRTKQLKNLYVKLDAARGVLNSIADELASIGESLESEETHENELPRNILTHDAWTSIGSSRDICTEIAEELRMHGHTVFHNIRNFDMLINTKCEYYWCGSITFIDEWPCYVLFSSVRTKENRNELYMVAEFWAPSLGENEIPKKILSPRTKEVTNVIEIMLAKIIQKART